MLVLRSARRALAAAVLFPVLASSALADPVADALPGGLHVGALVNLKPFLETFPELGQQGFLAEQLDDLAARGVPDPRTELDTLALGTQLGKPHGVVEGVAVATSASALVPAIRELAAEHGVPLSERTYRGTLFVTGTYQQRTSRFADPTEDLVLLAHDTRGPYKAADRVVDTLQGRERSFREVYGQDLGAGRHLVLRMRLSAAVRRSLDGTPLEDMAHMKGADALLTSAGARAQLVLRAQATSTLKAIVALNLLQGKLRDLADASDDPAVRRLLLEQTRLGRSGSTLKLDTDSPRDDFVAGILALEELLRTAKGQS